MNTVLARITGLIALILLFSYQGGAQTCHLTVNAGSDAGICSPSILQLAGSCNAPAADIRSISWTPISGLSNPTVFNPTATVSSTITYHLTVNAFSDSNLVVNGNFNAGINGFSTSYPLGTGGSFGLLSDPKTYAITTNPQSVHNNFAVFGDHTSGTGNMMVVNGDTVAGTPVFCQTVPVIPNTNYGFSIWAASCVSGSPAILQFEINSVPTATTFTLSSVTGLWQQYTQIWNSGTATSATICLYDQNLLNSGNDFAIDDIYFREICTATDSMTITLGAIGFMNLGNDTTLCAGQSLALDATVTNANHYTWNTGDTIPQITVNSTGTYTATASFSGVCPVTDSIHVTVKNYPAFTLGPDTSFCTSDSVKLDATSSPATSWLWNTGQTVPSIYASTPGTYSVIVSNAHCKSYDTIAVSEVQVPTFSLGNDTSLCIPDSIVLQAPSFSGLTHTWYDGTSGMTNTVTRPGVYWLEIADGGCSAREYRTISQGDCGSVFIPNVFSPNGDGRNDTWQVYQVSAVTMQVKIFNRWGELLFTADNPSFAWDGNYKGKACTQGVYYYVLEGTYPSGVVFNYRGSVTIIK